MTLRPATPADAEAMTEQYRRGLDEGKPQTKNVVGLVGNKYTVDWSRYHDVDWTEEVRTGVSRPCSRHWSRR